LSLTYYTITFSNHAVIILTTARNFNFLALEKKKNSQKKTEITNIKPELMTTGIITFFEKLQPLRDKHK